MYSDDIQPEFPENAGLQLVGPGRQFASGAQSHLMIEEDRKVFGLNQVSCKETVLLVPGSACRTVQKSIGDPQPLQTLSEFHLEPLGTLRLCVQERPLQPVQVQPLLKGKRDCPFDQLFGPWLLHIRTVERQVQIVLHPSRIVQILYRLHSLTRSPQQHGQETGGIFGGGPVIHIEDHQRVCQCCPTERGCLLVLLHKVAEKVAIPRDHLSACVPLLNLSHDSTHKTPARPTRGLPLRGDRRRFPFLRVIEGVCLVGILPPHPQVSKAGSNVSQSRKAVTPETVLNDAKNCWKKVSTSVLERGHRVQQSGCVPRQDLVLDFDEVKDEVLEDWDFLENLFVLRRPKRIESKNIPKLTEAPNQPNRIRVVCRLDILPVHFEYAPGVPVHLLQVIEHVTLQIGWGHPLEGFDSLDALRLTGVQVLLGNHSLGGNTGDGEVGPPMAAQTRDTHPPGGRVSR
mmetsp:Transcript_24151/g.47459  ORF Transcript_24151/g.47459 Transcript_24151/m.47459 type:complete len:457 (+) Transcript_24151:283-1653(+)